MKTIPKLIAVGLVVLCFGFSAWVPTVSPEPQSEAINVLLILVDTLRADHLGVYGYDRDTTPNIDRFAAKSAVFETAYSHSPWTMPSTASIFTSLPPRDHGLTNWKQPLPEEHLTLAEHLQAQGFHTEAYVSHVIFEPDYHFDQGFEAFDHSVLEAGLPEKISSAAEVTDLFIDSLEDGLDEPFFMWLHYFDPHFYYLPHDQFDFGSARMDLYDGEIRYTDEQIGRVFEALTDHDLWDNTIVVFVADHGEEFLDHGGLQHTTTLYEELIRIPLIIWVPGMTPHRIENIVIESDLGPTLCQLLGVPIPVAFGGKAMDYSHGRFRLTKNRTVFAEALHEANKIGIRVERWKYIADLENDDIYLFDLVEDPGERRNVVDQHPEIAHKLKQALDAHYGSPRVEAPETALTEERRRQLEALGYLQ